MFGHFVFEISINRHQYISTRNESLCNKSSNPFTMSLLLLLTRRRCTFTNEYSSSSYSSLIRRSRARSASSISLTLRMRELSFRTSSLDCPSATLSSKRVSDATMLSGRIFYVKEGGEGACGSANAKGEGGGTWRKKQWLLMRCRWVWRKGREKGLRFWEVRLMGFEVCEMHFIWVKEKRLWWGRMDGGKKRMLEYNPNYTWRHV